MASHICVGWALDWWLLELYKNTTEGFECYFFSSVLGQKAGWVSREVRVCTRF